MSENRAVDNILSKYGQIPIADIPPELIERGRLYFERLLKDKGTIKLSDIPFEYKSIGKQYIDSKLDLSQIVLDDTAMKFNEITTAVDLAQYLVSRKKIFDCTEQYVSHYTSIDSLEKILSTRCLYLNNPTNMNDGLEFSSPMMDSSKLYFASFTLDNSENIGMWSMYGQPWDKGVKITIPKRTFMNWVSNVKLVYNVNPDTFEMEMHNTYSENLFEVKIGRVAYAEKNESDGDYVLSCGERNKNEKLKKVDSSVLTGFIKDAAWSYEKEIRLRVDFLQRVSTTKVAVDIPNEIMNSLIITTGPRFIYNDRIKGFLSEWKVRKSIFDGKLTYIYCDQCIANR